MKVVFDTNVLLSATLFDESESQKLLFKLIKEDVQIFSSRAIIEEYQKVLKRDFHYSEEESDKIVENLLVFLILVEPSEKINIIKYDPDDNKILECAIASQSEIIITYDKHLLDLKEFKGIKILLPKEFSNYK